MDQPKLERLLRLMKLLTANTTYNVDQLAERLDMSRRTVYRYIDTFREAGFVIKKSGDCIRLDKESPHFRDISQLVHFTEEEAVILKNAIENIDDTNLLKQNLKRKLYSVYDNRSLADTVVRGKNAPNIRRLIEAIEEQRQVTLHGYQSGHGGEVRDRRVEPFAFTTNYVQVWCYDLESRSKSSSKPPGSAPSNPPQPPGSTRPNTKRALSTSFGCTAPSGTASGWSWGYWPTTCCAKSIRWPNATSAHSDAGAGCSTPRWPGWLAWGVSSSGCSTTSASSKAPS